MNSQDRFVAALNARTLLFSECERSQLELVSAVDSNSHFALSMVCCIQHEAVAEAVATDMTFVAAHNCMVQSSQRRHVSLSFLQRRQQVVEVTSVRWNFSYSRSQPLDMYR